MSNSDKKDGYTNDELKDLVILGLQQPGKKISEIKGSEVYDGTQAQKKFQELPIWHKKNEIDDFILTKLNVPESKLKKFPGEDKGDDRGRSPFTSDVEMVIRKLRKDEEIIDWNLHSGIWRLTNTKYLIEKFPEDVSDGIRVETTNDEIGYFLLRQKVDSSWNDELGKIYEFGDKVPNRIPLRDAKSGSKVVLHTTELHGNFLFWGYGTIDYIKKFNAEKKYHLVFKDFTFFEKTEDSIKFSEKFLKPDKGKYFDKKFKSCEGYSYRNSINKITREIYEEVINNQKLTDVYKETDKFVTKETFADDNLQILKPLQISTGLNRIREHLLVPDEKILEIVDALSSGRHILLAGPIGTGKTQLAKLIPEIFWNHLGRYSNEGEINGYLAEDHTATSDWNTQDVIGGIFPRVNDDGTPSYAIQNGCVVDAVQKNWQYGVNGGERVATYEGNSMAYRGVWLIIDEFNRADIDKAFGQLFTSLRTRELKIPTITGESYKKLKIPKDFRIIGTLNTQDKHFLFQLSDALKSRFAYIEIDIPEFGKKDQEMYYAANQAIEELELDQKRSGIQLNHTDKKITNLEGSRLTKSPRLTDINNALETVYTILDYVREFNKLGTAILKLMFQQIIVSSYRNNNNFNFAVENALLTNLIPQLENLSEPKIECLITLCKGQDEVTKFIIDSQERQDRQSYVKTIHLLNNITNRYGIGEKLPYAEDFENGEINIENFKLDTKLELNDLPRFIQALESLVDSNQLR